MSTDIAVAGAAIVAPAAGRRAAGLWSDALWRVRHDPTTLIAIGVLFVLIVLAAGADLLADNFFRWSFTKSSAWRLTSDTARRWCERCPHPLSDRRQAHSG